MAYSDGEIAEAMIRLAFNRYDYKKTAQELNLEIRTLRRWDKRVPKKGIGQLLERAITRLLTSIPQTMTGQEWSIALGILMDKWLVMNGMATSRSETINKKFEHIGRDEIDDIIAEADGIITAASKSSSPD